MKRRTLLKSAATIAATSLFAYEVKAIHFAKESLSSSSQNKMGNAFPHFGDGRDWFFEARYGMFVHWGLYSIPGWHEQHQWRARVPRAEYAKLADQWNPKKFNPEEWLDLMEESGMKYITPNYPNQGRHHELPPQPNDTPDWDKYMNFLKEQVRELCTDYGEIHGFWWDMNVPVYKDPSVNALIRNLQPKAVINNRGFDDGDFGTPERDYDSSAAEAKGFDKLVEACQSVGMESWGFKKDEDYYTDRHLISSIDRYLARNANYLLNVGPTGEGVIPKESAAILQRIGKWKASVNESFQKVQTDSELVNAQGVLVTKRESTLYIHMNKLPVGNGLKLKPINVLPSKATLLNNGKAIDCIVNLCPSDHATQQPYLRLRNLPVNGMANTVLVAKLEFDRSLEQIIQAKNPDTNIELTK